MIFEKLTAQEASDAQTWLKDRSIELYRSGLYNPNYPKERLSYHDGVFYVASVDRLHVPDGPWHAPTKHDESLSSEQVETFKAHGWRLDFDGRPVHPWADELLSDDIGMHTGKGFYREFGANSTADPILFRFDQTEPLMLVVQRNDSDQWSVAGGHVDPGETPEHAALREAREETLPPETEDGKGYELFDPTLIPIYQGPVADRRATLNAWPETTAYAIFLNPTKTQHLPVGSFIGNQEETKQAAWLTPAEVLELDMFGSHRLLVQLALKQL